jgi:NADPH:quinone reductase-like Zn-dependent oxidoreductase
LDLGMILRKRLTLRGTVMRARNASEKAAAAAAFDSYATPLLASGRIRAIIDRVMELDQAAEAHRYLEENSNFGKVVLRV